MTWWAAVLGFVGALAGSWGGQLIAARREDRRWIREQEREELRWKREKLKYEDANEHDLRKHWSEQRLHAYQACLTAFDMWRTLLHEEAELLYSNDNSLEEITEKITEKAKPVMDAVIEAVDRIHIIGSLESIEAAAECFHAFHMQRHDIVELMTSNDAVDPLAEIKDATDISMFETIKLMREVFRRDFGFLN